MTREEAFKYGTEWLKDEYLDAKDREFIKTVLEALKQEPCEDAIGRQAVYDALEKVAELFPWRVPGKPDTYDSYNGTWNDAIGRAEMEIEGLPPVNPQKTGHWIRWYEQKENDWCIENIPHCKCSECGKKYDPHSSQFIKYCNGCGARMFEPQEESEGKDG